MKPGITFTLLLLLITGTVHSQNADISLLRKINLNRDSSTYNTFRFVTKTATPVAVLTPLSIIGAGLASNNQTITQKGIVSGASLLLALSITTGFKFIIRRARPFTQYSDIKQEAKAGGFSFPSGHTTAAFATAASLSLAFPKWYVIGPSFLWASTVAYSRMCLGVHFPSDVLGGIIIGVGSSFFCYKAQQWVK